MLGPEYGGPRFCETPVIIYSSKWHNIQEKPSLQLLSRKKKNLRPTPLFRIQKALSSDLNYYTDYSGLRFFAFCHSVCSVRQERFVLHVLKTSHRLRLLVI